MTNQIENLDPLKAQSITTRKPPSKRSPDEKLFALIAQHDQLHRASPPEGLDEAGREHSGAVWDEIAAAVPATIGGVLALLEYADYESDPLVTAAVTGLRPIVEKDNLEHSYVPFPPGTTPLQKLIATEERIRSMASRISDAADVFTFWLDNQDQSVKELAAGMDNLLAETYGLYKRIDDRADPLLHQINATPPTAGLADAIALLETDDPPIDAVIAGLRAIAEKGGAA